MPVTCDQGGVAAMPACDGSQSGDTLDKPRMASLGAECALSRCTMLCASLGRQRQAHQGSRTAFGVGMAHSF